MQKTKVKLLQKTYVSDGYGGSEVVYNFIKEVSGYFVPTTQEISSDNSKVTVSTTTKFVSDYPINVRNVIVEYNNEYFEVEKIKNLYKKGSLMELKSNV